MARERAESCLLLGGVLCPHPWEMLLGSSTPRLRRQLKLKKNLIRGFFSVSAETLGTAESTLVADTAIFFSSQMQIPCISPRLGR